MSSFVTPEAQAKLEEAFALLPSVQEAIDKYFENSPFKLRRSPKSDAYIDVLAYHRIRPLAPSIAVRVGNILHNLHSALDYVACSAAISQTGNCDNIYFPFRKSQADLANYLASLKSKFPANFLSTVAALQPFDGGNNYLWQLHLMNRSDKHRNLVPMLGSVSKLEMSELIVDRGYVLSLGPRGGQHLVLDAYGNFYQNDNTKGPVLKVESSGTYMVFNQDQAAAAALGYDPFEVLTLTRGAVFKTDLIPSFIVTFEHAFPYLDANVVLEQMCQETEKVLGVL